MPWQGKLDPEGSRGSLGAEPGMGEGEEMNMCAVAVLMRIGRVAARAGIEREVGFFIVDISRRWNLWLES